jgi:hypothetical protein
MDETTNPSSAENGHEPAAAPGPSSSAGGAPSGDEAFGWTANDDESADTGTDARAAAERMLGQLQAMIDTLATQARPVVRQIGAKAAELAAIAADRAGPLAHKAADATADASERIAEKSRTWAADLRNRAPDAADAGSSASEALGGADDAAESSAGDDPAEGARG